MGSPFSGCLGVGDSLCECTPDRHNAACARAGLHARIGCLAAHDLEALAYSANPAADLPRRPVGGKHLVQPLALERRLQQGILILGAGPDRVRMGRPGSRLGAPSSRATAVATADVSACFETGFSSNSAVPS